jgi:hypothetical protein
MFVVKRRGKNGLWSAVSLIDKNGSFRGEAKFETRKEAEDYLAEYLMRMKDRLITSSDGSGQLKIFEDNYTKSVKTSKSATAEERRIKSSL